MSCRILGGVPYDISSLPGEYFLRFPVFGMVFGVEISEVLVFVCLGPRQDYATQFYRGSNEPLKGSL